MSQKNIVFILCRQIDLAEGANMVRADIECVESLGISCHESTFYTGGEVVRHNPDKLAKEILRLLFRLKPINERIDIVDSYLLNRKLRAI